MMCSRLARDVINKAPDAVIISSAWNDIGNNHIDTYASYMNRMVDLIKKTTKKPVDIVLRTTNVGTSSNMPILRNTTTPAIYRVAMRNNVQIFDLLGIMDKDIKCGTIVVSELLAVGDDKHYTTQGQEYIANQFKPLFDTAVQLTKKSEYPKFATDFDYIPVVDSRVTIAGFATGTTFESNSYNIYCINVKILW
ncbi:SGNH/GDSL hydrolase family protein [Peribacillus sp. NPDC096379]|uniref:SGNH/GDSL hydrolase family protein n=1 Tax=Peribacillus sp. NPDC096379 TaxID=3364393 RepID=UPI0037F60423